MSTNEHYYIAHYVSLWHAEYMLSFVLTEKVAKGLWDLNERIAAKFSFVENLPDDERAAISRYARISMIGASTRIENAVLTDAEVDWLDTILGKDAKVTALRSQQAVIADKISKDRERSIEEVAGCRAMLFLIYDQAKDFFPLTEATIRGLHHELLKFYSEAKHYLGKYKTHPNKVVEINHRTGEQRVVFETADPGVITETAVADLVKWYNETLLKETWSFAVSCELVFRFLAIHPFQDGNGRLGRGLFLLSLLHSPYVPMAHLARYLAIDRQIERHKEEYYTVLNRCSGGRFVSDPAAYQVEYFLAFMMKVVEASLADIDVYRRRYGAFRDLSPSALKVLDCFRGRPEIRLQTQEICKATGLPRRTVVSVLAKLHKAELVQKYGQGAGVRYQLVF